jgi:ribosomal protein L11 methyltransferase
LNYIWRKRAGARWLRLRNEDVTRRFGNALAIVERPRGQHALLEISCRTKEQAQELVREFGGSVEILRPGWLQHFTKQAQAKPLRIGSRLLILSASEKDAMPTQVRAHVRSVVIPAEAAFGTGEHATTAMCLRLLERVTRRFQPGWKMLDTGTGSGILAIAGSYFGARRVLAIDSDPLACATAKRNAYANAVRNVDIRTGDILKHKLAGQFDIITANIFSEILIDALPIWSRHLAAESRVILSGILRSQETTVSRALGRHGFVISEIRRRGKWIALVARLEQQKGS